MSRIGRIASRIRKRTGMDFWVEEVDNVAGDQVQAVADGPNKAVKITKALVHQLDDDELAYVLGHELAHIERHHTEAQRMASSAADSLVRTAVRVVNRRLANAGTGAAARVLGTVAAGAVGTAAAKLAVLGVSRVLENDADVRGIEISADAGFSADAAAGALAKIAVGRSQTEGIVERLLSTHPSTNQRAANLQRRAQKRTNLKKG